MLDALANTGNRTGLSLRCHFDGMDCLFCNAKIETANTRFTGAGDVRVNYEQQV